MEISEKAIIKMKHALGCDRMHVEKGIQEYHRNFYAVRNPQEEWETLVTIGYATKFENFMGEHVYKVSDKGLKKLESLFDVTFVRR